MNNRFKPYPAVDIMFRNEKDNPSCKAFYSLRTSFRLRHPDGRWFWSDYVYTYHDGNFEVNTTVLTNLINRLHREVYMMTHCGIVDEKVTYDVEGRPLFYLCEDQTDEKDRLLKLMI